MFPLSLSQFFMFATSVDDVFSFFASLQWTLKAPFTPLKLVFLSCSVVCEWLITNCDSSWNHRPVKPFSFLLFPEIRNTSINAKNLYWYINTELNNQELFLQQQQKTAIFGNTVNDEKKGDNSSDRRITQIHLFPENLTYITIVIQVLLATIIIVLLLKFTVKLHKQRTLCAQILVYLLQTSHGFQFRSLHICVWVLVIVAEYYLWILFHLVVSSYYNIKKSVTFLSYVTRRFLHFSYL